MSEAKAGVQLRASKKLNVKKLVGDVKAAILEAGGKPRQMSEDGTREVRPADWVELMRVVGVVSGFRTGQTQYGAWVGYTGADLAAINSISGEVFKGKEILLPEEGNIVLEDAVKDAVLRGATLKVAMAVEARLIPTIIGYEFRVKPLMPIEVVNSESLQMLVEFGGAKAQAALAALPAPTKAEALEDNSEKPATVAAAPAGKKSAKAAA